MGTLEDTRGSQRQLLVKYLFGEANIAYNFLQKFLPVLSQYDRSIHVQFSKLNSNKFSTIF